MIDVSIIVPTYNRCALLEKTLISLMQQDKKNIMVEILIIDDGSTDNTKLMVDEYKKKIDSLHYIYVEHDGYRVGYVRNQGIKQARGKIIVFLDSGMIVDSLFAYKHFIAHELPHIAVVGSVYGLSAVLSDRRFYDMIDYHNLDMSFDIISNHEDYKDLREGCLKFYDFDMSKMPAPYAFFWTGNVSIEKGDLDDLQGFDENITGWGMEDVELGYRLYCKGLKYTYCSTARSIHLPHDVEEKPNNSWDGERDKKNKKYFYHKYKNVDTELYLVACNDFTYNIYLSQFYLNSKTRFDVSDLLISKSTEKEKVKEVVVFGAHNGAISEYLDQPTLLEYDKYYLEILRKRFDEIDIFHSVGAYTPFENNRFKYCLVMDYWIYLDESLLESVVREATRIADKVLIFYRITHKGKDVFSFEKNEQLEKCLLNENVDRKDVSYICGDYTVYLVE